jgi:trigger factor
MEIKVKNIINKNLKKDYQIIVPNQLIQAKIDGRIVEIRKTLNLKGFRKGQVPIEVIKQKYGESIMADESDKVVSEQMRKIIKDNNLKIALQPKIDLKVFEQNKDLECVITIELFPEAPQIDLDKIKIVKKEIEIVSADIDDALNKLLKFYRSWNQQESGYKAKLGDAVNIDYVGKIDKKEFAGGAANSHQLELGSKSFIDDFEEQLVGKRAGDATKVKVKFPKAYHNAEFAGKAAEFEVKINHVLTAQLPEVDDQFIKNTFGLDSKEKLEDALKQQLQGDYQSRSKNMFKKELFDFLNKKYDFDLPEGLVAEQLKNLWAEIEEELKQNPNKFKNDKEKEKARDEQRKVAQRMIRCGMILSDIAQKNKIETTNEDLNQEIGKILARFPNQEKVVIEYYQKNPSAIQQLKGSIIEEKTVDFIIAKPSIEKKKISIRDFDKAFEKMNEV